MNYSNPILVCNENEEFRTLIRDILTRNGFFHVLESSSTEEAVKYLEEKKDYFVLTEASSLNTQMIEILKNKKDFIVFAHIEDDSTLSLTVRLGIEHFMSYPFHSKKLLEKMKTLL